MTTLASPDTQLAAALRKARRRGVSKATLCQRIGVRPQDLDAYAAGKRIPAAWIAREIAATVGESAVKLFPRIAEQDDRPPTTRRPGGRSTLGIVGAPPRCGHFPPPMSGGSQDEG